MKKQFVKLTAFLSAALGLLLLAACANPFAPSSGRKEGAGGKGLVRVGTGAGAARTALPGAVFDHYAYSFSRDGGADQTPAPVTEGGFEFELESGNWTVTVNAYAEAGEESLAATGSENFTVSPGEETEVVVKLRPVLSAGVGTLSYTLSFPAGAEVMYFTLTRLGDDTAEDLIAGAEKNGENIRGEKPVNAGYYLVSALLQKDYVTAGRREVAHIYQNMTTGLSFAFDVNDFTATLVTSNADSGPGSLRDAVANTAANGAIVVRLPESNRVITLNSTLAIDKSLDLFGNGAVITQSGLDGPLVTISDSIVTINRVHFKGGRTTGSGNGGAINNNGAMLTLESCIFSDNQIIGGISNGGAIYTAGGGASLTVLGSLFYENHAASGGAIYKVGGTVILAGNIFWGNTAYSYAVANSGINSQGFNISDTPSGTFSNQSGWNFVNGDKQLGSLPFVTGSFKPFAGGGADGIISARPTGYPALDFYGVPIPASNASAGAVQTNAGGYFLDYAEEGPGAVTLSVGSPDEDGLYGGSVTFTAEASPGKHFLYWRVNEAALSDQPTPAELILLMDGHKTVRGVFGAIWDVTDENSLQEALTGAADGDIMRLQAGLTITLAAPLPQITSSITIEGNGATLTQSGFSENSSSQFLYINSAAAEVNISRLHLKGGRATNNGAAIYNAGKLTLESCIFSDNRTSSTSAFGGAIYTTGSTASLTVLGSAFYGNAAGTSGGKGGAIYRDGGALALTGNVFWGNTASAAPVVYHNGGATTGGYNVSDRASGYADDAASSGWTFASGDVQGISPPLNTADFKPFSNGAAYQAITARPEGYPAVDFYGVSIPSSNAMSGAAQDTIVTSGYYLNYAAQGSGTVTPSGSQDAYGFYTGSVTLAATGTNLTFRHWIVNGEIQGTQATPNEIAVIMDCHKIVRATLVREVTDSGNAGAGTLRQAIQDSVDGDVIVLPSGGTITLSGGTPEITTSVTIEGNGATLTNSGRILNITSSAAEVSISRLHFKGGRTENNGAAINSTGTLTLESCIFSNNVTSGTTAFGGAIYIDSVGNTTISGCTFFKNTAGTTNGYGGAISKTGSGSLTLTGNLFWGNTANNQPVVQGPVVSKGYNVSDRAQGWTFVAGDALAPTLPLDPGDFKPFSNGAAYQTITARPEGYPTVDFYGVSVPSSNAMSGAVQTSMTPTGYYLDYAAEGPGQITVKTGSGSDGFYTTNVTLEATHNVNGVFKRWIVDGQEQDPQSPANELTLVMDDHKIVRAVFGVALVVNNGGDNFSSPGAGTLRWAVNNAEAGDTISINAGLTIIIDSAITINKNLIIEGNSATLTGSNTQLLSIASTSAEVNISRLLFKGARSATNNGAAINNTGTLTLESCIFYDNQMTSTSGSGGAIYTSGTALTVLGCTFSGNAAGTSSGRGGAINRSSGTVSLTGNIFAGNTARYSNVVGGGAGSTSNGYNVTDMVSGNSATSTTATGWLFSDNPPDVTRTGVTFADAGSGDFTPSSVTGLPVIPSLPAGFPTTYFDGTPRGSNSTPGAMPE
jgi:hypothetical protein